MRNVYKQLWVAYRRPLITKVKTILCRVAYFWPTFLYLRSGISYCCNWNILPTFKTEGILVFLMKLPCPNYSISWFPKRVKVLCMTTEVFSDIIRSTIKCRPIWNFGKYGNSRQQDLSLYSQLAVQGKITSKITVIGPWFLHSSAFYSGKVTSWRLILTIMHCSYRPTLHSRHA